MNIRQLCILYCVVYIFLYYVEENKKDSVTVWFDSNIKHQCLMIDKKLFCDKEIIIYAKSGLTLLDFYAKKANDITFRKRIEKSIIGNRIGKFDNVSYSRLYEMHSFITEK